MRDQEILDLMEAYASIYSTISESHFKVGDQVTCKKSGMKGEVVKLDRKEEGKYYTVEREDGKKIKYAPDELKKSNGGASKGSEEKFHSNLDKLVHKTFGKSPEEQKEEFVGEDIQGAVKAGLEKTSEFMKKNPIGRVIGKVVSPVGKGRKTPTATSGGYRPVKEETDLFDYILEYLVAEGYADTNENALVIMTNMSEEWRESILEGKDPVTPPQKPERPTALPGETYSKRQERMRPSSQVKGV
jgi:hypothetical protein